MTKDDNVDYLSQNLTCDDNTQQQQEPPFQIVLVDIERAVREHEIHCVKEPLTGDEAYVAVSYRWGELPETIVDTRLGYLASITSFDLMDFSQLCYMLYMEPDLQGIKYVWVDAICINQTNYEQRKATIHQMSDIYQRASYIVAIPDLHLRYLKKVNGRNNQVMKKTSMYARYLYELIHGNTDQLAHLDQQWLDRINVPKEKQQDERFRQWLLMATHDSLPPPPEAAAVNNTRVWKWKQQSNKRRESIQQAMNFLEDLIIDWSSRVWVISEFHIAKRRNNMKYWFIQLHDSFREMKLFDFDFDKSKNTTTTPDVVHQQFHQTMVRQLNQQSFLEMMLKSMASRDEDRFYAVLPGSKYKSMLGNKDVVDSWHIRGLISVKLKLFEWMDTKDKLDLLFLSANSLKHNRNFVFPTFATPTVVWPAILDETDFDYSNFDLTHGHHDKQTIKMMQTDIKDNDAFMYHLNIKPVKYYRFSVFSQMEMGSKLLSIFKRLQAYDNNDNDDNDNDDKRRGEIHQVLIPNSNGTSNKVSYGERYIVLAGSFVKNKWILFTTMDTMVDIGDRGKLCYCDTEYSSGFNIY